MKLKLCGDIWAVNKTFNIESNMLEADVIVANLETPITSSDSPIQKAGPSLKSSKDIFKKNIMSLFSDKNLFLTLANNHIGDYGEQGIKDTIDVLNELKIKYSGVSINNEYDPYLFEFGDTKIDIYTIGEKQFCISGINKLGINYISPKIYAKISESKRKGHFVIVSIHAAAEMFPFVSPYLKELYRSYIDIGADIIHGHHSHVGQGYEEYKNGLIFYGMGNFLFDPERFVGYKNANIGLIADVEIKNNKIMDYKVIPYEATLEDNTVFLEENSSLMEAYYDILNQTTQNNLLLNALWQEFSVYEYEKFYLPAIGYLQDFTFDTKQNRKSVFKKIEELIHLLKNDYNYIFKRINIKQNCKLNETILYHFFDCISHSFAIETALGIKCGEIENLRNENSKAIFQKFYKN